MSQRGNAHAGKMPRSRSPRRSRSRSRSSDREDREQNEALRDDLTVLVQRIHPRADDFEIFEFFSQAGKIRDIRLIRDPRSNKSKGVGYVEFFDASGVMQALASKMQRRRAEMLVELLGAQGDLDRSTPLEGPEPATSR